MEIYKRSNYFGVSESLCYGQHRSEAIVDFPDFMTRNVLANPGVQKDRIYSSAFTNGWDENSGCHAFAAVAITKEMSVFRKLLLSLTHTKVKFLGKEYFFNNNSFKKRLGVTNFQDMLKNKQKLEATSLFSYFDTAKNNLVAEKKLG